MYYIDSVFNTLFLLASPANSGQREQVMLNRIPGTATVALIAALTIWVQTYFQSWEYSSAVVIVLGAVANFIKIYGAQPEVPVSATGTARGLEPSEQPRGKLSRWLF